MVGVHKVVWVHEKIHFECACGFRRWFRSSFVFETPCRSDVRSVQGHVCAGTHSRRSKGVEHSAFLCLYVLAETVVYYCEGHA